MFSKTMICHIYLFVQIVYFILWNIYIVSNLSGWNTIFSDMQIYRTFIHIVFLTYLTNGVAVLWFQVVELWQNPGRLLVEVPFRKKISSSFLLTLMSRTPKLIDGILPSWIYW